MKLSKTQIKVMSMLCHRWEAYSGGSCSVEINGKRVCNVDTMRVLLKLGLVTKTDNHTWAATAAGLEWRP
jgi:hypothetical protein